MKLSAGTIGTVLFTAAGIAVFVLMAKRPAVDGGAMNFGMPLPSVTEGTMPETTTAPDTTPATTETTPTASTPEATAPTTEAEPVKVEEVATDSATSATTEEAVPASTDIKVENEPATMPADAPTVDGSMPAN